MKNKKSISVIKKGMNFDSHISQLQNTEYRFALNANTSSENGDGLNVQKESSNTLGVLFSPSYKVVGFKNDILKNRTYYLLTSTESNKLSPNYKRSKIGYVDNTIEETFNQDTVVDGCEECEKEGVLDVPLETITQIPSQVFIPLVDDLDISVADIEEKGFNFDINSPIKKIEVQQEKLGTLLYWEDNRNPPRYINVTDLEENTPNYLHIQEIPCGTNQVTDYPLLDKLLVFPKHSKIIIEAKEEQIGGNLKMGTYEFYVAYCDLSGNVMSEYSTPTNPISIFDENNNIQSQTTTDEFTNFAIKLQIKNLDTRHFKYYKVAVVERNNVEAQQSVFLAGIYPTTDDTVVYTHSGSNNDDLYTARGNVSVKKRMTLAELSAIRPTYEKFKGTMVSGNALWHFGATVKEEINLQPAINLFSLVSWSSSLAKEDLYKSAIATSKYKGYMRNEVQPFSIRFYDKNGGYTAAFPLIGRPKNINDGLIVTDTNFNSLNANTNICGVNTRTERWQIFNTAIKYEDVCDTGVNEITTEPETIIKSCTQEDIFTITAGSSTIILEEGEEFTSLEEYLKDNTIPEITPYVEDDYEGHCEVVFNGTCTPPSTPVNSYNQIQEVIEETITYNPKLPEEYLRSIKPAFCSPYKSSTEVKVDGTPVGGYERDTSMEEFMECDGTSRGKVYKRNGEFSNEECGYATTIVNQEDPTQSGVAVFMNYQGSLTIADLKQVAYPVYASTVGGNFYDKLHQKAQFFKASKNGISTGNSRRMATLTGSSGNVSLVIGGITYTTAFITSLTLTAASFVTAHAATILTATGAIVTSIGAVITIQAPTAAFPTITAIAGGLTETLSTVTVVEDLVLEITKKTDCTTDIDNLPYANNIRYTIYKSCTDLTVLVGGIVDLTAGELVVLDTTSYPSTFIVAIDAPIITESILTDCNDAMSAPVTSYKVVPPCGCFSIYTRNVENKSVTVSWNSVILEKVEEYQSECTFSIPSVGSCGVVSYQKGEFAYWESTETYPDNKQLYDSSDVFVKESDLALLSVIDKENFIKYNTINGNKDIYGNYIWKESVKEATGELAPITDLTCRAIRHFKFPDNTVSPYIFALPTAKADTQSLISPLGIEIDSNAVKTMLQVAANNSLITQKQLNNIQGYEILRGDNSIHKSVIANGVASDVYNYTKKEQVIHYVNFPFNDLGENKFCLNSDGKPIQHPHGGDYNHLFSFISPDMFLTKPSVPSEVSLQGYLFGSANASFTEVDKHSKWTVLGKDVYTTALTLAILESALELAVKVADSAETFRVDGGFVWSFNVPGAFLAAASAVAAAAAVPVSVGKYRYEWLKIFRDLGRTENFASFQTASSNYNRFSPSSQYSTEYLRSLAIRKHMRDGDFTFTDENNGDTLKVNNWLRENSVFLSTNKYFPFNYSPEYRVFDNNKRSTKTSSTFTSSEVGGDVKDNHIRNVASPYFSLKNYIPDQWGQIDSIKWLTTNYIFDLDDDTTCSPILGGTVCVSRFSWRKKTPIFTSNAIDEPDKLPFLYSKYDNIGTPRFYCDYEVGGVFRKSGVPFPDIKSTARFDDETGKNEFYFRSPSKFYLYTHGIVDFLVESEINCNFRYARNEPKDHFYPQRQDLSVWLQEKNLPISEPNTFFYNNTYTFPVSNTPFKFLDKTYDKEVWEKRRHQPNAWIWSEKDVNENSLINPWLIYKPLNWFEDKSNKGGLVDLRSIESEQFLGRFENQLQLYNTIDNLAERVTPQNKETGTGFFYQRPIEFKATELGFSGTQNTDICSTPYGHFWADAKRGRIFQLDQNGKGLEIISEMIQNQPSGMKNWFREHLPFKILKSFPQADIDNKFKGLGMNIWYDDRMSRVFFTKRDYITKGECLKYEDSIGFYEDCSEEATTCPENYTYNEENGLCEFSRESADLCPAGYVYDNILKTCTLIEVVNAVCTCTADVFATSETICSGSNTDINLTSTGAGISYSWTVVQSGVTGALVGSGSTIAQTLTTVGLVAGTATYTITPFETISGCLGTPIIVVATVNPIPNVIATPSSLSIDDGDTAVINLTSNIVGTTFTWTVVQSGVTGATAGSGSTITQPISGNGNATYTVTPTNSGCSGAPIEIVITVTACIDLGLSVGDSYGGGTVIYIAPGGCSGIISANTDIAGLYPAGKNDFPYFTTTGVGGGYLNTINIVSALDNFTPEKAAEACNNLTLSGYSDWYLPSKDELLLVRAIRDTIGGFTTISGSNYWSSSDNPTGTQTWYVSFYDGAPFPAGGVVKESILHVRAVRNF